MPKGVHKHKHGGVRATSFPEGAYKLMIVLEMARESGRKLMPRLNMKMLREVYQRKIEPLRLVVERSVDCGD